MRRGDDGASTVEYGLMLAAIAGALVVILVAFGTQVTGLFTESCDSVRAKADPSATC
jgi:pilus assembly protein Flp/PilA